MGMYDTFWVKCFDNHTKVQTKQFRCSLDNFGWLDKVSKKSRGNIEIIQEYEDDAFGQYWINFVLSNGFFVDYSVNSTKEESTYNAMKLKKIWKDFELNSYVMSTIAEINAQSLSDTQREKNHALRTIQDLIVAVNHKSVLEEQLKTSPWLLFQNRFVEDNLVIKNPLEILEKDLIRKKQSSEVFDIMATSYFKGSDDFDIQLHSSPPIRDCTNIYNKLVKKLRVYIKKNIDKHPELIYSTLLRKCADERLSSKYNSIENIQLGKNVYKSFANYLLTTKPSTEEVLCLNPSREHIFNNLDKLILDTTWLSYILQLQDISEKERELILKALNCLSDRKTTPKVLGELIEAKVLGPHDYYNNLNALGHVLQCLIKQDYNDEFNHTNSNALGLYNTICAQDYYVSPNAQLSEGLLNDLRQSEHAYNKRLSVIMEKKTLSQNILTSSQNKKIRKI